MIHAPVSDLIARRGGTLAWQAIADWEPVLFGPEGLRLEAWRNGGHVDVVKHGVHRTVYRVEYSGRAFYVKHYRRERFRHVVAHLLHPSAARREWRKMAEIARRGIRTVRPVAWAERTRGGLVGDNYLVTEAIPGSCPVEPYVLEELSQLPADIRPRVRRRFVESLARFVAAIHRAGILHDDFHVDNVLVRPGNRRPGGMASLASPWTGKNMPTLHEGMPPSPLAPCPSSLASPELYLIDVPGVRFSGPLKWSASRASLIMLSAGWWERTSQSERLRFWQTYLSERPDLEPPEPRSALEEIERGAREYRRRVARSRDKRALRTNRDYVALRQPDAVAHGVADLGRAGLDRLMEDAEALLERNLDRPIKLGHGKRIVEAELPLSGHTVHVAYARYSYRNGWKALVGRFRRSRAVRGWHSGHALLTRRIATPRPIAVCRVRRSRSGFQHYLATEWIEGSENLHLYGWRLATQSPADRFRRAARTAECLGELIGRMHASQIAHGDLKASNLLVVEKDGKPQAYVIDAEDVRITRRLTSAQRLRDLARLTASLHAHPWITRTVLCRFLRAYVGQFPPRAVAWKPLWRETARRSRRIVGRKRRRGEKVL